MTEMLRKKRFNRHKHVLALSGFSQKEMLNILYSPPQITRKTEHTKHLNAFSLIFIH